MDGTKPAMESTAEEPQDEGQESKGTGRAHLYICAFFMRLPLCRLSRLRQPERFNLLAMASPAAHNSGASPPLSSPDAPTPTPPHLFRSVFCGFRDCKKGVIIAADCGFFLRAK